MTIKKYIESEKEINENSLLKSKNTCISELNQQQGIDMDAAITAVDNLMVILDIEFADFEGCPVRSGANGVNVADFCSKQGLDYKKDVSSPSMFTELGGNNKKWILEWMNSLPQDKLLPTSAVDD
ncbi:hypothetical protein BATDEDRAFT_30122 [Batrachochytrium dendrobatidis JAM81]|uniref:Uncharacterized protein n=1 Tax=Batrachochytrium dendrobatidis (strain JAM81 / FGSC 10211) TaxID=684364 RepID=F4P4U8_BATDJ|nr:uncharacterized protein BATDEDRAFT_30122 [Batrachochytrium dendrobatidis JAM81]EGF79669.1 hypothetical protein BATDEDRAFT_30122 [Batrachochytrium dendrobatidis JAM81]|eukprot:XP_006679509.1 hypothetical protein BATDEDRAFT_30122 [Batrachochytrium dendrobatidis JAM81]